MKNKSVRGLMISSSKANFKILFSFLLFSFFISSCAGRITDTKPPSSAVANLKITVIDRKLQKAVPQARVSLKINEKQIGSDKLTDENGQTTFSDVPEDDGYIAFVNNAVGYKSGASALIKVVSGDNSSNVFLDRIGNGEGTGLIAGSVKDKTNKLAVSKLTVTYTGPKITKSILTDENGSFVIEGLVAGNYTLTFNKVGYAKYQKQVTVKDGQSTNVETIFLDRQGAQSSSGNFLVSLSGSKKVVEVDKLGAVVWSYSQLGGIESASRISSGDTIVSDGIAAKVLQINNTGNVINSFGANAVFSSLKYPSWVDSLNGTTVLVTDNGANKVSEFSGSRSTWSYNTGLSRPRSAIYLNNGNILITDTGNRRVIEVNKAGSVVWSYADHLDKPVHAVRLSNGNTLITDSGYSRLIEVDFKGTVVWWFAGPTTADSAGNNNASDNLIIEDPDSNILNPGVMNTSKSLSASSNARIYDTEQPPAAPGNTLLFPRSAVRLDNGNTLVADTGNNRIVEVSKNKTIVWELGNLSRPVSVERL